MLDVRSTGWTDTPTAGPGGGQGNDRPGRRPDILATGDTPGRPDLTPGHGDWGRSATHDGSAVTGDSRSRTRMAARIYGEAAQRGNPSRTLPSPDRVWP
jgi:hypothetical protein